MQKLTLVLPIKTVSEANQSEHWMKKWRRKKAQQKEIHVEWIQALRGIRVEPPFTVRLTRIGGQRMDADNLAGSFKYCQDQIARELQVDDGDERITWLYEQEPGRVRQYQVRIEIDALAEQL